jgi:hypothetical protein
VLPGETTNSNFDCSSSEVDDDELTSSDDDPDDKVHHVLGNSIEDVLFVIDFSGIKHVEDLNNDENVENVGEMSRRSEILSEL